MKQSWARSHMVAAVRYAVIAVLSLPALYYARSQAAPPAKDDQGTSLLPDGAGKELVQAKCLVCHGAKVIMSRRGTKEEWNETMDKMISNGASVSDEEADKIVDYLASHFGPAAKTAPASSAQSGPAPAPPAPSAAQ